MNQEQNNLADTEESAREQPDRSPAKVGATLKMLVTSLTSLRVWWSIAVGLALTRMFLVAHDEIVPMSNDARNYAFQVQSYLTQYGVFPAQPPGIVILAIAAGQIGIPYKLALDWLFMATCIGIAIQFRSFTNSGFGSLIVLGFLMLNPWFAENSIFFMSEPVIAVLLLLLLASARGFLSYPVNQWSWHGGIASCLVSAAIVVTRPEQLIVLSFWVLVVLLTLVLRWKSWQGVPVRLLSWRWVLLLLPFVGTIGGHEIVKRIHRDQYGVASLAINESQGLKDLLNALYTINPDEKIRFAPVTVQSLSAACDVSPTLNRIRDGLLDKSNPYYSICKTNLKIDGQFGTWLNWLLVNNFRGLNAESNRLMLQAATEIRTAQREGRLKHRPAMYPIDPLTDLWIKDLPRKFCEAHYHAFWPYYYSSWIDTATNREQPVVLLDFGCFDDGLMRRLGTNPEAKLRFHGTLNNDTKSEFVAVQLETPEGKFVAAEMITDSPSGQPEFRIETPAYDIRNINSGYVLAFIRRDDASNVRKTMTNSHAFGWETLLVERPAAGDKINPATERWRVATWAPPRGFHNREAAKDFLRIWAVKILLVLMVIMFLAGIKTPMSPEQTGGLVRFLIAGIGLNTGRLLFFALLEVWTMWGMPRYAGPNHLLTVLILLIAAFLLGSMARKIFAAFWHAKSGQMVESLSAQT